MLPVQPYKEPLLLGQYFHKTFVLFPVFAMVKIAIRFCPNKTGQK